MVVLDILVGWAIMGFLYVFDRAKKSRPANANRFRANDRIGVVPMKWVYLFFLMLLPLPAAAGEIDYFCIFANTAAAQADANVGIFWNGTTWDASTTFPGVSVVTPAALVNGISPITGFWIMVARPSANAGLDADTACVMKLDRDLGAVNGAFVLGATLTGTNRTTATFQPVPHGSNYPRPLGK
jgi:hypothetical protein